MAKTWSPPENDRRLEKTLVVYLFARGPARSPRVSTCDADARERDCAAAVLPTSMHRYDRGNLDRVATCTNQHDRMRRSRELSDVSVDVEHLRDKIESRSDKGDTTTCGQHDEGFAVRLGRYTPSGSRGVARRPVCMGELVSIELPDGRPDCVLEPKQ